MNVPFYRRCLLEIEIMPPQVSHTFDKKYVDSGTEVRRFAGGCGNTAVTEISFIIIINTSVVANRRIFFLVLSR